MSLDGRFLDVYCCQPRKQEASEVPASGSTSHPFEPAPAPADLPDTMSPKRIRVDDCGGQGRLSSKTLRELIGATHEQAVLEKVQPSHESMPWARSLRLVHCPTGEKSRVTNISACTLFGVAGLTGDVLVVSDSRLPQDLNSRDPTSVDEERKAQEAELRHLMRQQQQAPISFGTSIAQPASQIAVGVPHFWIPPSPYTK